MPYINKDELLNSLTDQNIIDICTALGSPDYKRDNGGNLCFNTSICHGGNSKYKLIYYKNGHDSNYNTPIFKCYTCSKVCSIIELVISANRINGKQLTWYQALSWIAQFVGYTNNGLSNIRSSREDIVDDFNWIRRIKAVQDRRKVAIPRLKVIPETYLEVFTYLPHEAWLNDGVSRDACDRYEIGYWPEGNQITIPHRDMNGNLIGIRGRYLSQCDIDEIGKYVPIKLNGHILSHSLGSVLYGAWVTKDKIKECRKALVVEGEKSCLKAYTMFRDNSYVVATCGSSISLTHQKILLNELGIEELIYMPDKDYKGTHDSFAAQAWLQKQKKKLAPFVPYCKVYLMWDADDTWDYKSNAFDFNDRDTFIREYDKKILITTDSLNEKYEKQTKEEDEDE